MARKAAQKAVPGAIVFKVADFIRVRLLLCYRAKGF
jgi:hypothetical protein